MNLFPATKEGEIRGRCLPVVTEEDIRDRSKSDALTKVFAFIQCAWLVTQCLTRVAVGLPLTELELMTFAFIVAAVVMYGFWWHKPFDVQRATMLVCPHERASEIRSRLIIRENSKTRKQWRQANLKPVNCVYMLVYALESFSTAGTVAGVVFATIGAAVSGLHIAAWNWDFPAYTIRILWRVFSVAATCCFPAILFSVALTPMIVHMFPFLVLSLPIVAVYMISRLSLIFLAFYCFLSMPAAVYETVNWNTIFPHFS